MLPPVSAGGHDYTKAQEVNDLDMYVWANPTGDTPVQQSSTDTSPEKLRLFRPTKGKYSIVVYNYQGGAIPDVKVLDIKRSELRERFDELYRVVNPAAAKATRQAKLDKLKG